MRVIDEVLLKRESPDVGVRYLANQAKVFKYRQLAFV